MTPKTPQDFLDRADECERLAEISKNPEARETLLYVASRWRALAEQDKALVKARELETEPAAPG